MSFGFDPGDIVALITFSKKVCDALENEEGSQIQYRRAMKQCDAFATVINQVKRVDLSHFPTDFRQELEEIYTNAAEHITLFRKNTIDKYEKSLGQGTKRGLFASAPRKVQWAFGAAEDLEELRQSLGSWLSAIQTCITTNMCERSLRNEGPFPAYYALPGPAVRSLTLPQLRQEPLLPTRPLYLDWAPPAIQHLEVERTVSLVLDLVYKRLLSTPGLPIAEAPKVFTLGPGDDAEADFLQVSSANAQIRPQPPQPHPGLDGECTMSHPPNEHDAITEAPRPNIVDDTNSYLQDMQLPPLTASEAANLSGRNRDPQIPTPGIAPPEASQVRSPSPSALDFSRRSQVDTDTLPHASSRARGSPLAYSSLVGSAAKTSYTLRVLNRGALQPHHQVERLSRKLKDYSDLLRTAETAIGLSSSNSAVLRSHRGSGNALDASVRIVGRIAYELDKFASSRGFLQDVLGRFVWMVRRRWIMEAMADIDGLKTSLLIMLQVDQMEDDRNKLREVAGIVEALGSHRITPGDIVDSSTTVAS